MTTISQSEAKWGMKVLLTDPDPEYSIGRANPKTGTKWECEGTISSVDSGTISVDWDNGDHNGYKGGELSPSGGGICVDLWEDI